MGNKATILCTGALNKPVVEHDGISIDVIPFIKTQSVSRENLDTRIKPLLRQKATVIFTSANAIDAVAACLGDMQPGWTVFCIGHNTRLAVENYFGAPSIAGVADDAEKLAEIISEKKQDDPVIFFCGDQRRRELPDILDMAGITVKEIVVYTTIGSPVKVEENYDGILFFSPSAVQSFFSMNKVPASTVLFCIGSTTAKAIQGISINPVIISEKPDKEALLKQAIEYFNK